MSKKKEQKKAETKKLIGSQVELMQIKIQALSQVANVLQQRKAEITNSINLIALELGVPEEQLGEWGLTEDGKNLIRVPKKKGFPSVIRTSVKKREKKKKKKPGSNDQPEKEG